MSHLLIPGPATATTATMWAAAIDEPDDPAKLEIVVATGERQVLGIWDYDLDGGKRRVHIRRVEFTGLGVRSRRLAELRRAGGTVARAMMGTLPKQVPSLEERPFTILLGSCFAQKKDGAGNVGRTFALLPSDVRPDLKLLCGDQVYLDAPSFWTVFPAFTEGELKRRLLESYLAAWTQEPGYHTLLADGPNAFTADDHDFWNNAPKGSVTAPATLIPGLRKRWLDEATRLYRAFQRPDSGLIEMDMEGLSIRVGEVRVDRTDTDERFMTATDLDKIRTWASDLKSPGCLVLGQVLFTAPAGTISRHMDLGLPDFQQYSRAARRPAPGTPRHRDPDRRRALRARVRLPVPERAGDRRGDCVAPCARCVVPKQRVEDGAGTLPGRGRSGVRPAADHHREGLSVQRQSLRDDRLQPVGRAGPYACSGVAHREQGSAARPGPHL